MIKPSLRPILMVSNGPGEDWIGVQLAKALQTAGLQVIPIPMVGPGEYYQQAGWEPLHAKPLLSSGGFYRSWGAVWSDIKQGVCQHLWEQRQLVRQQTPKTMATIAVGDVACLGMATFKRTSFFLPTAKSDRISPHSIIECFLIKRWAHRVFPRDDETAQSLIKRKIKAQFIGNIMMDGLVEHRTLSSFPLGKRVVILPGSRGEAIPNLTHVLNVLSMTHQLGIVIEVPPHFNRQELYTCLEAQQLIRSGDGWVCHQRQWHVAISIDFPSATKGADVVVGLAGTANEQAAFLNRRVISIQGTGPQTTHQRMSEQARLMPQIRYLGSPSPEEMKRAMLDAFSLPVLALPPVQQVAHHMAQLIQDDIQCAF